MFVSSSWSFILNIFSWNLTISITYWYPLINQLYYTSKIQVTSSTIVHSFQGTPHWTAPEVLIYSDSEQSFASTVSIMISYIRRFSFRWFWIQVVLALLLMYGAWGVQLLNWQQQSHLGASIKGMCMIIWFSYAYVDFFVEPHLTLCFSQVAAMFKIANSND